MDIVFTQEISWVALKPALVPAMAGMIASGVYDLVLGSRILGVKLSEYHTGFRAYSRSLLGKLPFLENSDDFVFDNQVITQAVMFGFRIGEISCPTSYFPEASSIGLRRSIRYGMGVLETTAAFVAHRTGIRHQAIFEPTRRTAALRYYSHPATARLEFEDCASPSEENMAMAKVGNNMATGRA